ncbi:unnamed protein product [Spodoptera littoralis]|uniref:Uncharacterized protein n=1 Tax=Spodoptera littoralis TaxID=7109 RepID=A0A9P0I022_SPOLI|nr:unnamed protein product [Spodoptera littoralis]CAH1638636.1 unnamed protein product [Spodoptera littoralis]
MAEEPVIPSSFNASDVYDPIGETEKRCEKLDIPAPLAAFFRKTELHRNFQQIIQDQSLLEKVAANYVIVKKIISFLPWQDKIMCKNVCSMWRSAVNTLQKEQIGPADFAISLRLCHIKNGLQLVQSDVFYTEPLMVLVFGNMGGFGVTYKCETLLTCPCDPPCEKSHHLIDLVDNVVVAPKKCMLAVKVCDISYKPLKPSKTNHLTVGRKLCRISGFIVGMYIPVIPNVNFQIINIKCIRDIKTVFMKTIDKLAETDYIKGALVFVNGSFILHSVDDIVFLNYLKEVQPNVPYALGGCIVEDTVSDRDDMNIMIEGVNTGKDLVTENIVSIGLFSVPKSFIDAPPENGCNFDMFSLILESSDWSKAKIQSAINEFAKKVPHFEHSVVIKMSCVGRDNKHDYEQELFRAAFPKTRLAGCYGNGELGINHPERLKPESFTSVKRHRADPGPAFGIMYSYSTIFVYIGWGNIVTPAQST